MTKYPTISLVKEPATDKNDINLGLSIRRAADLEEDIASRIGSCTQEHFLAYYLDIRHKVIGVRTISIGTVSMSIVHPRDVYCAAVHCMASGIIVAHNHPSGDETPSAQDREVTQRLKKSGEILGIPLVDHIIYAFGGKIYSFRANGGI